MITDKSAKDEGCAIVILAVVFCIAVAIFMLIVEAQSNTIKQLKLEAIEHGYAEWTVDINGESTWNWIPNPNKEITNGN